MSPGYTAQDSQAMSVCPGFVLLMHIKRHRQTRKQVPSKMKKIKLIISKKPYPKPMSFYFRFEVQCGEPNPAFQPSNS